MVLMDRRRFLTIAGGALAAACSAGGQIGPRGLSDPGADGPIHLPGLVGSVFGLRRRSDGGNPVGTTA